MASVITRTEKGLPLSTLEADGNFVSLETDVNLSVKNSSPWVATSVASVGEVFKHLENYYLVTVGGTTGSSAPVHVTGTATNGTATLEYYQPSGYTPKDVLDKLLRMDGPNSGLDADIVHGLSPSSTNPVGVNKSSLVSRDSSGNFSATNITSNLTGNVLGNSSSATLATNSSQLNGKTEAQLREELINEMTAISIALG